jgi:hypothetical protein
VQCLLSIFFAPLATSNYDNDDQDKRAGNTNGDWISFLLALGISHLPTGVVDIDVAVWSRAIALLLTGLLILSSLAQVLRSVTRILSLTSKTVGAGFLLLSLGQLFVSVDTSARSDSSRPHTLYRYLYSFALLFRRPRSLIKTLSLPFTAIRPSTNRWHPISTGLRTRYYRHFLTFGFSAVFSISCSCSRR